MDFKQELAGYGRQHATTITQEQINRRIDKTISKTFARVAGLLFIAFGVAYATAFGYINLPVTMPLFWGSWIAGLGIIFRISYKRQSLSYNTIAGALIVFALLEGYGLSGVFMAYNIGSIYNVFMTAGIAFAVLSIIGYRTTIDLMKVGPILMGALIGLIIAIVINFFRNNTQFDLRISIIGLVVFAGFIIYDMNLLKQQALYNDKRTPLLIALGLFINFINIFLFLLRLMGGGE